MANRLNVTDLDFDTIKSSLKSFLSSQSEFTDYDFEGSGLNVLIDLLAYNTHYNAYYLNMISNESFLDTALLRNSVVSHAKKFGYTPRSSNAAKATINFTVYSQNTDPEDLTLPEGYTFLSNLVDNKVYNFVTLEDTTIAKNGNTFTFSNLEIYEGELVSYTYNYTQSQNPKQIFTIPDSNVDTSTLKVSVRQSASNTDTTVYTLVDDVISLNSSSEVYFLQEGLNEQYQIYFGDDVIGKKLPDGCVLTLTYLTTNGDEANLCNSFVGLYNVGGYSSHSVAVSASAAGGSAKESVDQIKFAAPLQFTSQNRAVTKNDYVKLIQQRYPEFQSVNVWGGEENTPPVFGKIFISAKPRLGFTVSDTEKQNFINNVVKPISVMTVTPEFVDPDYDYLKVVSTVYYDPTKTSLNVSTLRNKISSAIDTFCNNNLNTFNSLFRTSLLKRNIDDSDNSVISNDLEIFLTKKFRPNLVLTNTYTLDYGVELQRGTTLDNFYSSPAFTVLDEQLVPRQCFLEEVPSSYTGVESINVITPGFNYTSTPTVEIVGDGSGATASAVIVNGQLSTVKVTNSGIGYTTAIVRIIGGGGSSATAQAVLENRYGSIRIVYFKPDEVTSQSVKVVLNYSTNNGITGTIDYLLGRITINNFNPIDIDNDFKELSVSVRPKINVIQLNKNKMLAFDDTDPSSVVINLKPISN
jgi:hypothetical protein